MKETFRQLLSTAASKSWDPHPRPTHQCVYDWTQVHDPEMRRFFVINGNLHLGTTKCVILHDVITFLLQDLITYICLLQMFNSTCKKEQFCLVTTKLIAKQFPLTLVVKVHWDKRNRVTHQKYQFNQGTSLSYPHHFNPSFNLSSFGNVVFLFKVCERIFFFWKTPQQLSTLYSPTDLFEKRSKVPALFLDAPYVWPLFWIIS